jgi:hypothetical protein
VQAVNANNLKRLLVQAGMPGDIVVQVEQVGASAEVA